MAYHKVWKEPSLFNPLPYSPEFLSLWEIYPRKKHKQAAFIAFLKVNPENGTVEKIIQSIQRKNLTENWRKDGGKWIPYLENFLMHMEYEDEVRDEELDWEVA